MESIFTKILIILFSLPVILVSGIFLRKKSRPYNNILFTVHKIIAVVYIIFTILVLRSFLKDPGPEGIFAFLLIFTAALIVFSFITGALQSFEKPPPSIVSIIHKASSYLMFICLPLTFIIYYNL